MSPAVAGPSASAQASGSAGVQFSLPSWLVGHSGPPASDKQDSLPSEQPAMPASNGDESFPRKYVPESHGAPAEAAKHQASRRSVRDVFNHASSPPRGSHVASSDGVSDSFNTKAVRSKSLRARLSATYGDPRENRRSRAKCGASSAAALLSKQQNTYLYAQRKSMHVAAKSLVEKSSRSNSVRRFLPSSRRRSSSTLVQASKFDSYKFDGEESKVRARPKRKWPAEARGQHIQPIHMQPTHTCNLVPTSRAGCVRAPGPL